MPKPGSERPDAQVTPAASLEKRTRRRFTPEYKLSIIAEAAACQHGELGLIVAVHSALTGVDYTLATET